MAIEAIVSVKILPGFTQIQTLIVEIQQVTGVNWARLAFGPGADIVTSVKAKDTSGIAQIAIKISAKSGVGGVVTTILADV